ncbi:MAG: DUF2292 domain-containing protein [Clostridiales bacterium]|nr:YezD family protein [Eubacteriales bacterium]MDH7566243.1 DUF2292 domain-containing protein [Clostridiales bacterium]
MAYQKEPAAALKEPAGHCLEPWDGFETQWERDIKGKKRGDVDRGLTEKEEKLIRIIRDTGYGEVRIVVQDKQPVRVEELKKSIKL